MAFPEPKKKAPPFSLKDSNGRVITLSGLQGKNVVLYFYPKDDTPGCTIEAHEFSSLLDQFKRKNTVVYGVSRDDKKSHTNFIRKCNLKVPLLSDLAGNTLKKYGALKERTLFGNKFLGIQRSTILINEKGIVKKVWKRVQPLGHAKKVLEAI